METVVQLLNCALEIQQGGYMELVWVPYTLPVHVPVLQPSTELLPSGAPPFLSPRGGVENAGLAVDQIGGVLEYMTAVAYALPPHAPLPPSHEPGMRPSIVSVLRSSEPCTPPLPLSESWLQRFNYYWIVWIEL
jgi:hypothetical protein